MARTNIIISDSNNPSYDGNLSTVDGFYQVEGRNMGVYSVTILALSTTRYITQTFANAGNCQGIVLALNSGAGTSTPRGVRATLQQILGTVTMSIANPCVVTFVSHGLADGSEVEFSTSGALPTGVVAGTKYYSRSTGADTFNLYDTAAHAIAGGATGRVTTTGSQSGTHTLYVMRAEKSLSPNDINPEFSASGNVLVTTFVPFKFTTPFAVDTTASKWRFRIEEDTTYGATTAWGLITSNATAPAYATWCDTKVTATNGDIMIVADRVVIDKSFTTGGELGTGDTVLGVGGWICRNTDISEANVALLEWDSTPASSYTFTFGGCIITGSFGGFRCGTSTSRIPFAQKAIITRPATITVGTVKYGFNTFCGSRSDVARGKTNCFIYGEIPTKRYGVLASDAAISQAKITLTEDMSADWQVGDTLIISKSDVIGQGQMEFRTIQSFNGAEITLTSNLTGNIRKTGGTVINFNRGYGVELTGISTTEYLNNVFEHPNFFSVSGCKSFDAVMTLYYLSSLSTYHSLPANRGKRIIEDNLMYGDGASATSFCSSIVPNEGFSVQRNLSYRYSVFNTAYTQSLTSLVGNPAISGLFEFKNNRVNNITATSVTLTIASIAEIWDNAFQNSYPSAPFLQALGKSVSIKRNEFWGAGAVGSFGNTSGAVFMGNSVQLDMSDNTFDSNQTAIHFQGSNTVLYGRSKNDSFGQTRANTYDFSTYSTGFVDFVFDSPAGNLNADVSSQTTGIVISKIKIQDENNTANKDRVLTPLGNYQRCGTSLADTNVHTAGGFSQRMEAIQSAEFATDQFVPTGDITGKDMTVAVWVKINSANYYGGTYVMPKLTVYYDNEASSVSASAVAGTGWQLLVVSFTPTTSYPRIRVKRSIQTDALTTNSYVYWDDMSVLFPAGTTLNLGTMDLWADAEPITPMISTTISAADVWTVPTAGLTGAGTTGKKLVDGTVLSDLDPLM